MNTVEQLEKNLDRFSEWIKTVDQKVSIFLAFQGVFFTLVVPDMFKWLTSNYAYLPCRYWIFLFLGIFLWLYSIIKCVLVIIPRLKNSLKKSIFYFKDVAQMNFDDYKSKVKNLEGEKYKDGLIEQAYILAGIATCKHHHFRDSIVLFLLGTFIVLTVCILFSISILQ